MPFWGRFCIQFEVFKVILNVFRHFRGVSTRAWLEDSGPTVEGRVHNHTVVVKAILVPEEEQVDSNHQSLQVQKWLLVERFGLKPFLQCVRFCRSLRQNDVEQ